MTMCREDMERFAFLFLCGERDRALLAGREKMQFLDFDRLSYITEFLGLTCLNMELWKRFSPQFQERLKEYSKLLALKEEDVELQEYDDEQIYEEWLVRFYRDAPEGEAQRYLKRKIGIGTDR